MKRKRVKAVALSITAVLTVVKSVGMHRVLIVLHTFVMPKHFLIVHRRKRLVVRQRFLANQMITIRFMAFLFYSKISAVGVLFFSRDNLDSLLKGKCFSIKITWNSVICFTAFEVQTISSLR